MKALFLGPIFFLRAAYMAVGVYLTDSKGPHAALSPHSPSPNMPPKLQRCILPPSAPKGMGTPGHRTHSHLRILTPVPLSWKLLSSQISPTFLV